MNGLKIQYCLLHESNYASVTCRVHMNMSGMIRTPALHHLQASYYAE